MKQITISRLCFLGAGCTTVQEGKRPKGKAVARGLTQRALEIFSRLLPCADGYLT